MVRFLKQEADMFLFTIAGFETVEFIYHESECLHFFSMCLELSSRNADMLRFI